MDDVEAAAAAETEEDDENEDEEDEDAEADESFDAVSSAGERGIPERILIEGTCGEQDPDFFCCFVVFDVRLRCFDASLGRLSGASRRDSGQKLIAWNRGTWNRVAP